jgi:signal transduction histidine kinase
MLSIQKGLLKRLLIRCGLAVGMVAVAFLLRWVLTTYVGPGWPVYITFYPAVMLVATVAGFWPGVVATAVAALVVDYWVLPPIGSFGIASFTDAVGLALFSGMGVFMSLVAEFYRRARQQAQERSLELTKANEILRNLSSKLLSTQEDERKRIAGELHDTIGSCLNGVKYKIEAVLRQIGKDSNPAEESLSSVIPVIQEGIEECRRMQQDLRPSMLDDLGLLPTLSWFCRRYQTIYTGIKVDLEQNLKERDIPNSLKTVIYRVTQEGMNNIAKHSKADLVHLSLRKMDGRIELVLKDNGQGFDLEKVLGSESTKRGLGLTSMRERAEFTDGFFSVESTEGKGTIIRASWPC